MNFKYKILISGMAIFIAFVFLYFFSDRHQLQTVYSKLNEVFNPTEEKATAQSTLPSQNFKEGNKTSETNNTNKTEPLPPGGAPKQPESNKQETGTTAPKALTLEITDICSGKFENVFSVSEGMQSCLNEKSPYFILLEKNSTRLQTSFYNVT